MKGIDGIKNKARYMVRTFWLNWLVFVESMNCVAVGVSISKDTLTIWFWGNLFFGVYFLFDIYKFLGKESMAVLNEELSDDVKFIYHICMQLLVLLSVAGGFLAPLFKDALVEGGIILLVLVLDVILSLVFNKITYNKIYRRELND